MGLEAAGMLDACVWEIQHPDCVHPEFRQVVISAVRERAAEPGHACTEFVDDWVPE